MDTYTFYDRAFNAHTFSVRSTRGYYSVYLNGQFFCSADSKREAEDEIESYVNDYHLKSVVEVL